VNTLHKQTMYRRIFRLLQTQFSCAVTSRNAYLDLNALLIKNTSYFSLFSLFTVSRILNQSYSYLFVPKGADHRRRPGGAEVGDSVSNGTYTNDQLLSSR
jgi:hypothetical protein